MKEDIRQNCGNVAEMSGFLGRIIHGPNTRLWLRELKRKIGERMDYSDV
jgi:hypothetical protein